MYVMNKYNIILSFVFILISSAFSGEGDAINVNEKYDFLQEIYDESWALIIGIDHYHNVPTLNYAVADAEEVSDLLIDQFGFKEDNVKLILNEEATKDNILKGFRDVLTNAQENDRVLVFYAGHGETYKLPSGGDMGYLIPIDGNPDDLYLSSIPMNDLNDIATMSYAKHILYLVDACYGGLTLSTTRGLKKEQTPAYLKKLTRERGRMVITAGGKGEEVIEKPEWGHSAFTRNLIKGLKEGLADDNDDDIITGDELGSFIKNRVILDVDGAHTPQIGRLGSDMGEFVFISAIEKEVVESSPKDQQFSDLESELDEIKKMLLKQAQDTESLVTPQKKINLKTASTLAWVFPGMGHYYSGRAGKGLFFTSLELAALAGMVVASSSYAEESSAYKLAEDNYENNKGNPNQSIATLDQARIDAFIKKQDAMLNLAAVGTLSAGIWIWNILDVKKTKSQNYSSDLRTYIGINSQQQIVVRFCF